MVQQDCMWHCNYSTTSSTMGIVLLLVSYYCNYWHNTATTGFRLLLLARKKAATKKEAMQRSAHWNCPKPNCLKPLSILWHSSFPKGPLVYGQKGMTFSKRGYRRLAIGKKRVGNHIRTASLKPSFLYTLSHFSPVGANKCEIYL